MVNNKISLFHSKNGNFAQTNELRFMTSRRRKKLTVTIMQLNTNKDSQFIILLYEFIFI